MVRHARHSVSASATTGTDSGTTGLPNKGSIAREPPSANQRRGGASGPARSGAALGPATTATATATTTSRSPSPGAGAAAAAAQESDVTITYRARRDSNGTDSTTTVEARDQALALRLPASLAEWPDGFPSLYEFSWNDVVCGVLTVPCTLVVNATSATGSTSGLSEVKLYMSIPSEVAPRILGMRGSRITQLRFRFAPCMVYLGNRVDAHGRRMLEMWGPRDRMRALVQDVQSVLVQGPNVAAAVAQRPTSSPPRPPQQQAQLALEAPPRSPQVAVLAVDDIAAAAAPATTTTTTPASKSGRRPHSWDNSMSYSAAAAIQDDRSRATSE